MEQGIFDASFNVGALLFDLSKGFPRLSDIDEDAPRSHYHYRISLGVRHPSIDPAEITAVLGIEPGCSWRAGQPRRTPKGTPLAGVNRDTRWGREIAAGRWPLDIDKAIHEALRGLIRYRSFLHRIRAEGGTVELFIGWFFENQSGEVLTYECLALAGDLQIDLSFDVYPPEQPQHEYEVTAE